MCNSIKYLSDFFLFSLFLQVLAALGHAAAAEEEGRAYEVRRCPRVLQWLAGNQEKTTTTTTRTITRTRTLDVQRPQGEKDRSSSVEKTCCNGALYKKRKKNCRAKKNTKVPSADRRFFPDNHAESTLFFCRKALTHIF